MKTQTQEKLKIRISGLSDKLLKLSQRHRENSKSQREEIDNKVHDSEYMKILKQLIQEYKTKKSNYPLTEHDRLGLIFTEMQLYAFDEYLISRSKDRTYLEQLKGGVMKMNEKTNENPENILRVALVTPYIKENQFSLKGLARIVYPISWMNKVRAGDWNLSDTSCCDLAIIGSTENSESIVRNWRCSGLLAARYSKFYGGMSGYSQELPEHTGYSFDVPKNTSLIATLLNDKDTVNALLKRDAIKIREALEKLNSGKNQPILATPYLEEALSQ